jgi:thimet oligopeptidase
MIDRLDREAKRVGVMLANFTCPSGELPSLISHSELSTLFHEFGHIMNSMSYQGEYALQSVTLNDFAEAMSSIFENWIWDYDVLKSFAEHYESGEVLPEETFQKMLTAKNVNSGLSAQRSVEYSVYDMMLYDRYDPENPMPTDAIWPYIGKQFVMPSYIEGTHTQASWIHVNTHPVYMYGYLWSDVYAQDMFTKFEENGLKDTATGFFTAS